MPAHRNVYDKFYQHQQVQEHITPRDVWNKFVPDGVEWVNEEAGTIHRNQFPFIEEWRRNVSGALVDDTTMFQSAVAELAEVGSKGRSLYIGGNPEGSGSRLLLDAQVDVAGAGISLIGEGCGFLIGGGLGNIRASSRTTIRKLGTAASPRNGAVIAYRSISGRQNTGGGMWGITLDSAESADYALHVQSWYGATFVNVTGIQSRKANLFKDTVRAAVLSPNFGRAGLAATMHNHYIQCNWVNSGLTPGCPSETARMIDCEGFEEPYVHNAPNCFTNFFYDNYVLGFAAAPVKLGASADNQFFGLRGGSVVQLAPANDPTTEELRREALLDPFVRDNCAHPGDVGVELCSQDQDLYKGTAWNSGIYLGGLTVTAGSPIANGVVRNDTMTNFNSNLKAGDKVVIVQTGETYEILSIDPLTDPGDKDPVTGAILVDKLTFTTNVTTPATASQFYATGIYEGRGARRNKFYDPYSMTFLARASQHPQGKASKANMVFNNSMSVRPGSTSTDPLIIFEQHYIDADPALSAEPATCSMYINGYPFKHFEIIGAMYGEGSQQKLTFDYKHVVVQWTGNETLKTLEDFIPAGCYYRGVTIFNQWNISPNGGSSAFRIQVGDGSDANRWGEVNRLQGSYTSSKSFTTTTPHGFTPDAMDVVLTATGGGWPLTVDGVVRNGPGRPGEGSTNSQLVLLAYEQMEGSYATGFEL